MRVPAFIACSPVPLFTCSIFRARPEKSGRQDSNLRPLAPHASALAKLRHAPFISIILTLPGRIRKFILGPKL